MVFHTELKRFIFLHVQKKTNCGTKINGFENSFDIINKIYIHKWIPQRGQNFTGRGETSLARHCLGKCLYYV